MTNLLAGLGLDEVFVRTDPGDTSELLTDALGSVLGLVDTSGAIATEYTYEPFGTTTTTGAASANASQFTGRENDATGLHYYRARYYQPGLQRFVSEDPIGFLGGDPNLYAYVWNDPTRIVDPLGLWGFGIEGGGTAEVGAGPKGGAAYQAFSGVGVFGRGLSALNVGGYTASGGFAGAANRRQFVMGATAGLGAGAFFTNATKAEDLLGPFDTWSVNLPIVSLQFATDGTTGVFSFAVGRSWGFSISRYTVTTTNASTFVGRK